MLKWLVLYGAVAIAVILVAYVQAQAPTPRPLFTAGQTVGAILECTVDGCAAEQFTVREVRNDGWLLVRDRKGVEWFVNTARIYAFEATAGTQVAHQ